MRINPSLPSRALAHQDLGGDLWRGPVGLPLSHLVESITKGPMSLECGLGIEMGVSNPGRCACLFPQRFLLWTGLTETPGVWGRPSCWAPGQSGRRLQMVILMPEMPEAFYPVIGLEMFHSRGKIIAADRFAKS